MVRKIAIAKAKYITCLIKKYYSNGRQLFKQDRNPVMELN